MALGEFEVHREFLLLNPGEGLMATLETCKLNGEVKKESFPVSLVSPRTHAEAVIPSQLNIITVVEIDSQRLPISLPWGEAVPLRDPTGYICGFKVGVLTIRKVQVP